jgi:hypothetical protein
MNTMSPQCMNTLGLAQVHMRLYIKKAGLRLGGRVKEAHQDESLSGIKSMKSITGLKPKSSLGSRLIAGGTTLRTSCLLVFTFFCG